MNKTKARLRTDLPSSFSCMGGTLRRFLSSRGAPRSPGSLPVLPRITFCKSGRWRRAYIAMVTRIRAMVMFLLSTRFFLPNFLAAAVDEQFRIYGVFQSFSCFRS
ncbi:hypothetical protein KSP40_PGU005256 [Platanthera guangdongensis]|uniref:Transmembrane protein n=1 Tax=Platanthera guangdongensis TaxID=2320717 RepID=A0ABR2LKV6_9ASPA